MDDGLYQVQFYDKCAGFVVEGGVVVDYAPVLRKKLEYWKTVARKIEVSVGYHVGFTGSQVDRPREQVTAVGRLFLHLFRHGYSVLHLGDCIGADTQAWNFGTQYFRLIGHPPINPIKRAFLTYAEFREEKDYIPRNHDIVDESHVLVAAPQGPEQQRSGTWATIRYAKKQGKPTYIVWPDGQTELKTWVN